MYLQLTIKVNFNFFSQIDILIEIRCKCFFSSFSHNFSLQAKYIQRLKAIRATLLRSDFFQTHEVIGSSLLFVHDRTQASIWMIDFAKTVSLPAGAAITHINEWIVGNHEDGYLIGINNLIQIFEEIMASEAESPQPERQLSEFDFNDDVEIKESETQSINCTTEFGVGSTKENNVDLPQEIDAMKIDQSLQHFSIERTEDNRNQAE